MKRGLIVIIILIIVVGVAAFFYTRQQSPGQTSLSPSPTPYSLSTVNLWNGLTPGSSTADNLISKLGQPVTTAQNGAITTYSYPSTNQYWNNEVDVENGAVTFIRERIFAPTNNSFKGLTAKLTETPIKLFGPDHQGGEYLYVYPQEGVAYLASPFQDTVYQIWRFPSTTIGAFMSLPQAATYGTAPTGQPEGI